MCLIIAPGSDGKPALLPREVFDYVYARNNDGFGGMYVKDGRVEHFKNIGMKADEIYSQMEQLSSEHPDVIFHMRYKTHGKIIPGLSHPFRILHKNRHGKDLFFMHNGILSSFGGNLKEGQSDTTVFKDKILIPLLTRDPDALNDPEVMDALNKLTTGSRLIFMDSEGNVWKTSESSWNSRYGLSLSNTYMLPSMTYEEYTKPKSVVTMGYPSTGEETKVTKMFIYSRQVARQGILTTHWCSCPKEGFIRTDAGQLYRDNGPDKNIYHDIDYIPKEEEYKYLGSIDTEYYDPNTPFDDDDVPFDWSKDPNVKEYEEYEASSKDKESSLPAPLDMRLRYARLVHNLFNGSVTSRSQLIADLIGMGDEEMGAFISEDPSSAHIILAELIEMVLEYNDVLWQSDPNHEKILDAEMVIEQGSTKYHQKAMEEISRLRKVEYQMLLDKKKEEGSSKSPAERSAEVFSAAWGEDCNGEECDCARCKEEADEKVVDIKEASQKAKKQKRKAA